MDRGKWRKGEESRICVDPQGSLCISTGSADLLQRKGYL